MASGSGRYRFLGSLAFFLSLSAPSLAGLDPKAASSFVTGVAQTGVAAFALLVLFTFLLTARFLGRVFMDWRKAKKEGSDQAHVEVKEEGHFLSTLAVSMAVVFAVAATGILIVVFFMMSAGAEVSSASKISSWIVRAGVTAFGLFLLYSSYRLVLLFLGTMKKGEGSHGESAVTAEGLALNPELTRRSFLSLLGWAWVAFTAATLGALSTCLRFAFPNVTFEPPSKFKVGFPDTFGQGVDNRFKDQYRVWIVRNEAGFYALSTICTHLGCTPNWLAGEQKFKCPCHGSGYYITGVNFEGPAPRPLERFMITLADDGQIEIDQNLKFQEEKGEWGKPGSFLTYKA